MDLVLLPLADVRPHEEIHPDHVQRILTAIVRDKLLRRPLILSTTCDTLLDGHHRYHALCRLGADYAPCIMVDYDDPARISVASWRPGFVVTPQIVRLAASSGVMLPPKTSRHILKFEVPLTHVPLADLFARPGQTPINVGFEQERRRHA